MIAPVFILTCRLSHGGALQWLCLVNEHNGNIVPDFIDQPALVADQSVSGFIKAHFPFAFRADQNIEQLLTYRHDGFS
jgi:hypothetical protein